MLGDTLTIAIDGANKVLARINQDNFGAQYLLLSPTEEFAVSIRHSKDKPRLNELDRDRHNVRLTHTIFGTAGAPNIVRETSVTLVGPRADDKAAFSKEVVGVGAYLSAVTTAKILGWES